MNDPQNEFTETARALMRGTIKALEAGDRVGAQTLARFALNEIDASGSKRKRRRPAVVSEIPDGGHSAALPIPAQTVASPHEEKGL